MNTYHAFSICWGFNLHFTDKNYSVIKYGTNTKAAISRYEGLSAEQKFRYEWFKNKFQTQQNLVYCCLGCGLDSISMHYGNKDDIYESYIKFKKRREAQSYELKKDIKKFIDQESKDFLYTFKKYIGSEYSPEFIILLGHADDLLQKMYNSDNLLWAKEYVHKLIKYQDFFNSKKYLPLLNQQP